MKRLRKTKVESVEVNVNAYEHLKNEKIEQEMKKVLLQYAKELDDVRDAFDKLLYDIKVCNAFDYNNNKEFIDSYIIAINNLTDTRKHYDISNCIYWLGHEKNTHENDRWSYEELEYLIHHDNWFNYNGVPEWEKWAIDRELNYWNEKTK